LTHTDLDVAIFKPKFHLTRHVTSRHDTTCLTCRARRDERVEAVEPCCSTSSTQPKMQGPNTSNVSRRVETWHDEPSGMRALLCRITRHCCCYSFPEFHETASTISLCLMLLKDVAEIRWTDRIH